MVTSEMTAAVSPDKPMIYDGFMFLNELDVLEIRLNELDPVVDKFVLVEGTKTFTGKEKPLYFERNKQRYSKFLHKIIHVIVEDFPIGENQWAYEKYQRNAIARGLKECRDIDIVVISDADEIPRPNFITLYNPELHGQIMALQLSISYYFFNCVYVGTLKTCMIKILPYSNFKLMSAEGVRYAECPSFPDAGWHFSFLGDVNAAIYKMESWGHQELVTDEIKTREHIEDSMREGKDVFNRDGVEFKFVEFDKSFPKYVQDNRRKFEEYIWKKKY